MKLTKLILLGVAGISLVLLPRRSSKPAKKPTAQQEATQSLADFDNANNADNKK